MGEGGLVALAGVGAGTDAAAAAPAGKVLAMDLPGARIDRLKENLARANGVDVALVQADVLAEPVMALREHALPESFSAVVNSG